MRMCVRMPLGLKVVGPMLACPPACMTMRRSMLICSTPPKCYEFRHRGRLGKQRNIHAPTH